MIELLEAMVKVTGAFEAHGAAVAESNCPLDTFADLGHAIDAAIAVCFKMAKGEANE